MHLPRSCFVVLLWSSAAFPQSDAEKFAEGRIAFDAHHDCPAALDALQSVSDTGRKSPLWAFYMGKVEECLKRPTEALKYYEQYDQLVPGQPEVLNKIGELRYQLRNQSKWLAAQKERKAPALEGFYNIAGLKHGDTVKEAMDLYGSPTKVEEDCCFLPNDPNTLKTLVYSRNVGDLKITYRVGDGRIARVLLNRAEFLRTALGKTFSDLSRDDVVAVLGETPQLVSSSGSKKKGARPGTYQSWGVDPKPPVGSHAVRVLFGFSEGSTEYYGWISVQWLLEPESLVRP